MLSYARDVFPYITTVVLNNRIVNARRRALLAAVSGDVLEIGIGSGLNLPFYGAAVKRVVGLDPSQRALRLAKERIDRTRFPVAVVPGNAEQMELSNSTFDAVVLTWTLCSVQSPAKTLHNIRRVLRPTGCLYFLEHGLAPDARVRYLQNLWGPIHRKICAGCQLTLAVDKEIESAGFRINTLRKGYMSRPKTLAYVYQGIARNA